MNWPNPDTDMNPTPDNYQLRPMSLLRFLLIGIIAAAVIVCAGNDLMNRKETMRAKFTAPAFPSVLDSVSTPLFPVNRARP